MLRRLERIGRLAGRFGREAGGVAAMEFALIAPILLLLTGGAVELGGAITAGNRATYVAETIGQVIGQTQTTFGEADLKAILRTASIVDPDIVDYARASGKSLDSAADVVVSSIVFAPQDSSCTTNCKYDASVVFSEGLSGTKRACGPLKPGDGDAPDLLPADVYSANPVLEVKVTVRYRPIMTSILGSEVAYKRVMYFRPRYVDHVNYVKNCPGYPTS